MTLFTKIINGEIPGRFVWADDVAVAFSTIAPVTAGHVLVVPREPFERFTDADDATLAHLMHVAAAIGRAQETAWDAPRSALLVAGFEIPHLHIHVFPVWESTTLSLAAAQTDVPGEELDAAAELLRAALRDAGYGATVPVDIASPALG